MKNTITIEYRGKVSLVLFLFLVLFCGPENKPRTNVKFVPRSVSGPKIVTVGNLKIETSSQKKLVTDLTETIKSGGPGPVIKKGDTIKLTWDATVNLVDTILYYKLYFFHPGDTVWRSFNSRKYDSIPASPKPEIAVLRGDLDPADTNRIFYFGVVCVTMDKVMSDMHASSDSTADSISGSGTRGWYVNWIKQ